MGSEVNDKFRKYIYLDSGLLLSILNMDFGGSHVLTELILADAADDLVNKGGLAEMMLGWEQAYIHPHFTGSDKGLYATMKGGRIDPSSCLKCG